MPVTQPNALNNTFATLLGEGCSKCAMCKEGIRKHHYRTHEHHKLNTVNRKWLNVNVKHLVCNQLHSTTHSQGAKITHLSPIVLVLCTHRGMLVYHHISIRRAITLLEHILLCIWTTCEHDNVLQYYFNVFEWIWVFVVFVWCKSKTRCRLHEHYAWWWVQCGHLLNLRNDKSFCMYQIHRAGTLCVHNQIIWYYLVSFGALPSRLCSFIDHQYVS